MTNELVAGVYKLVLCPSGKNTKLTLWEHNGRVYKKLGEKSMEISQANASKIANFIGYKRVSPLYIDSLLRQMGLTPPPRNNSR